jgi:hypothetical protein
MDFQHLVGRSFEYKLGKFEITQSSIDMLQYSSPIRSGGHDWYCVSYIYWGQGYYSSMYANHETTELVVTDGMWDGDVERIKARFVAKNT